MAVGVSVVAEPSNDPGMAATFAPPEGPSENGHTKAKRRFTLIIRDLIQLLPTRSLLRRPQRPGRRPARPPVAPAGALERPPARARTWGDHWGGHRRLVVRLVGGGRRISVLPQCGRARHYREGRRRRRDGGLGHHGRHRRARGRRVVGTAIGAVHGRGVQGVGLGDLGVGARRAAGLGLDAVRGVAALVVHARRAVNDATAGHVHPVAHFVREDAAQADVRLLVLAYGPREGLAVGIHMLIDTEVETAGA